MTYLPNERRYQGIPYVRCGKSGLQLPRLSLGLWQNFDAHATDGRLSIWAKSSHPTPAPAR